MSYEIHTFRKFVGIPYQDFGRGHLEVFKKGLLFKFENHPLPRFAELWFGFGFLLLIFYAWVLVSQRFDIFSAYVIAANIIVFILWYISPFTYHYILPTKKEELFVEWKKIKKAEAYPIFSARGPVLEIKVGKREIIFLPEEIKKLKWHGIKHLRGYNRSVELLKIIEART